MLGNTDAPAPLTSISDPHDSSATDPALLGLKGWEKPWPVLRVHREIWRVALLTCKLRKTVRKTNQDKENENPTIFNITVTRHKGFR